jgi:hypothetical protein
LDKKLSLYETQSFDTTLIMQELAMRRIATELNALPGRFIAAFFMTYSPPRFGALPGILIRQSPPEDEANKLKRDTLLPPPQPSEVLRYGTRYSGDWNGAGTLPIRPVPDYEGLPNLMGHAPPFTYHDGDAGNEVAAVVNAINNKCVLFDQAFEATVLATQARHALAKARDAATNAHKLFTAKASG